MANKVEWRMGSERLDYDVICLRPAGGPGVYTGGRIPPPVISRPAYSVYRFFYFLNTEFSCRSTICTIHLKLCGYDQYILLEGRVSQNLDLGPVFFFMIKNIRNSKKKTEDLNQNFETRFPPE